MKCLVCGHDNPGDVSRCVKCSATFPPRCISCGAPLAPGLDLCDNCRTEQIQIDDSILDEPPVPPPEPVEEIPPRIRAPFVGRMEQLQKLKELFLASREERTLRIVTVVGQPGVGKSRLALEFCRSVRAATDTRVLSGTAGGPADPSYGPIISVLAERFGIAHTELARDAQDKIESCVAEVMPERQQREVSHLLSHLMRVPFAHSPVLEPLAEVPGQMEVRTFIAARRFFQKDSESRPLLIHIDCADRAGSETVNLIHYLAEGLRSCPVLFLITARPTLFRRHPNWGQGEFPHHRMEVLPLSAKEAEGLFTELIHTPSVPLELIQVARDRLGGIPRCIEDLTRYLLESGCVKPTAGQWVLSQARLSTLTIPRTHEEILRARIKALPVDEQEVLEKAASVGETFWLDALISIIRSEGLKTGDPDGPTLAEIAQSGERNKTRLTAQLESLCTKGLLAVSLQSTIAGEKEYHFAYPPLWDLAHEMLEERDRRHYHHLVAQWIELRPEGRLPERQEEAGRHRQQAGDMVGATARFRRAADAASLRYFNDKAIRLYLRALACVGETDLATRMHLWHDLGNVYQLKGDLDSALDAFERMLRLSWVVASRSKGAVAFNKMGRVWRQKGNLDLALEYLQRGRELFRQAGDKRGVATSMDDVSQTYWMLGRYKEALDLSAEALEARRELADKRSIAVSLSNIGNIERDRGLFDEAEACYQEAMKLRKEVGDRYGFVTSLTHLGALAFERGELQPARDYWEDALTEAEQIGALPLQVILLNYLSETALSLGKNNEARKGIERAMTLAQEIEDKRAYVEILRNLALLELNEGHNQLAKKYCEECLELATKAQMRDMVGRAYMTLGEAYAATLFDESGHGDSVGVAEEHFRAAIKVFREMGNEAELAKGLRRLGEYQVEKGSLDKGLATLKEATKIFDRLGMRVGDEVRKILKELA